MSVNIAEVIDALEMSPWGEDNRLAARIRAEGIAPPHDTGLLDAITAAFRRGFAEGKAEGGATPFVFKRRPECWHFTELKAVADKSYCEGWNDCIDYYFENIPEEEPR